jgi:hypothetical protein
LQTLLPTTIAKKDAAVTRMVQIHATDRIVALCAKSVLAARHGKVKLLTDESDRNRILLMPFREVEIIDSMLAGCFNTPRTSTHNIPSATFYAHVVGTGRPYENPASGR